MSKRAKYGTGFYKAVSSDLQDIFPDVHSFSVTNLKYMRYFYEMYLDMENRQQAVDELREDAIFHDSSYTGQLSTYVVAVNHQLKAETDNPTIGLLVCKGMDRVEAKYALEGTSQPIGVSGYQLSRLLPEKFKGSLPTIEEIEAELSNHHQ